MFDFPLYPSVSVEKSTSSFGRYVVKVSEVTFRFFWKKAEATKFAKSHNADHSA